MFLSNFDRKNDVRFKMIKILIKLINIILKKEW